MAAAPGASATRAGWRRLNALREGRREELKSMGSVKMEALEGSQAGTKVIDAKGVAKSFGDKQVIRDFTLRIHRGDRVGIVGPNGAGKTTLLNLLTGIALARCRQCEDGHGAGDGASWTRTAPRCIPKTISPMR